jgi:phospholipase/carboxylesterase
MCSLPGRFRRLWSGCADESERLAAGDQGVLMDSVTGTRCRTAGEAAAANRTHGVGGCQRGAPSSCRARGEGVAIRRSRDLLLAAVCLAGVALSSVAIAQEPSTEPVDPMRKEAGDFLGIDLEEARAKASAAYRAEDYTEAARRYLALLRYDIDDAVSIYNLACCYGLLGEPALAAKCLRRAVDAGFRNLTHLQRDPDFNNVRGQPIFDAAVQDIATQLLATRVEHGQLVYVGAPSLLPCRVDLPRVHDPEKGYLLVIGLHGVGDDPAHFLEQCRRLGLSSAILVAPQAPYALRAARGLGYSWWLNAPQEERVKDESVALSGNYVADVVSQIKSLYPISKVYLFGFSQGGAFSYDAGIGNPGLYDGIVSFGGWLEASRIGEDRIDHAKSVRVFIAHGRRDQSNRFQRAVEAKELLTKRGYDVTFLPFEGGHELPDDVLEAAAQWMSQ